LSRSGSGTRLAPSAGPTAPSSVAQLADSFDHDVIDGAPAARFAARLKKLSESGWIAVEPDPSSARV